MLKYDDISPTMRNFLGAWEGFRKLGFMADDLHCLVSRSANLGGALACFVLLKTQGKQFTVEVGRITVDEGTWRNEYDLVTKALNDNQIDEADLNRIWQESLCYRDSAGFLLALTAKNITIPMASVLLDARDALKN